MDVLYSLFLVYICLAVHQTVGHQLQLKGAFPHYSLRGCGIMILLSGVGYNYQGMKQLAPQAYSSFILRIRYNGAGKLCVIVNISSKRSYNPQAPLLIFFKELYNDRKCKFTYPYIIAT